LRQRLSLIVRPTELLSLKSVECPRLCQHGPRLLEKGLLNCVARLHQESQCVAFLIDGGGELRPVQ
jgi:hypothetical protein